MAQRKRKKKKVSNVYRFPIILGVFFLLIVAAYIIGVVHYTNRFLPGTKVNGIDISGKTFNEAFEEKNNYKIGIIERQKDNSTIKEYILGEDIGLKFSNEQLLKSIINEQNSYLWVVYILSVDKSENVYNDKNVVIINDDLLHQKVDKLKGFKENLVEKPEDAIIVETDVKGKYEIKKEIYGNQLDAEKTFDKIKENILLMKKEIDLSKEECYLLPNVLSNSEDIKKSLDVINAYLNVKIKYDIIGKKVEIPKSTIENIVSVKDGQVAVDKTKIIKYVQTLKNKYDTIGKGLKFTTSYNVDVTVNDGDYGWKIDEQGESEALYKNILNCESVERQPVYASTGDAINGYGDTYIEINLTSQHMFLYSKGKLVVETDITSGNTSEDYDTPEGIYSVKYKTMDGNLRGVDYESPVNYWIPFNGGVGIHDSYWKNIYGANYYQSIGSHGCINTPYSAIKTIYDYVYSGMPVICYKLPGTESSSTTSMSPSDTAQSIIDRINRLGNITLDSIPRIRECKIMYNEVSEATKKAVTNYKVLQEAEKTIKRLGGKINMDPSYVK